MERTVQAVRRPLSKRLRELALAQHDLPLQSSHAVSTDARGGGGYGGRLVRASLLPGTTLVSQVPGRQRNCTAVVGSTSPLSPKDQQKQIMPVGVMQCSSTIPSVPCLVALTPFPLTSCTAHHAVPNWCHASVLLLGHPSQTVEGVVQVCRRVGRDPRVLKHPGHPRRAVDRGRLSARRVRGSGA